MTYDGRLPPRRSKSGRGLSLYSSADPPCIRPPREQNLQLWRARRRQSLHFGPTGQRRLEAKVRHEVRHGTKKGRQGAPNVLEKAPHPLRPTLYALTSRGKLHTELWAAAFQVPWPTGRTRMEPRVLRDQYRVPYFGKSCLAFGNRALLWGACLTLGGRALLSSFATNRPPSTCGRLCALKRLPKSHKECPNRAKTSVATPFRERLGPPCPLRLVPCLTSCLTLGSDHGG